MEISSKLSRLSISNNEPNLIGLSLHAHNSDVQQGAKKKFSKKRHWHLQRDSLNRRNKLLIGKEGSRRRNRWDNNHFTDHPLAVRRPEDLQPPGYSNLPSFHFRYDEALASILVADVDHVLGQTKDPKKPSDLRSSSNLIHRGLKNELKRSHVPRGVVQKFETELLGFLRGLDGEKYEWVVVEKEEVVVLESGETEEAGEDASNAEEESPPHLVWDISDRFARWIVHAMCRYYALASFSRTTKEGQRLTYVCRPCHLLQLSDSESDDEIVLVRSPSTSVREPLRLPEKTFFDYLFP